MRIILLKFIFLLLVPSALFAQQKKVAFTFDDLPAVHGETATMQYVTQKIISRLQNNRVPATGFVNEGKLYRGTRPDSVRVGLLEDWLRYGFPLGNHTYSHVYINQATIEQYKQEIIKGEQITRQLATRYGRELKYFRHPQLRTGPTEDYKHALDSFLDELKYVTAPVTMDNDEYIFANIYAKAKKAGNTSLMKMAAGEYIAYMDTVLTYYENLTLIFFERHIHHVLLLHANELNADYLDSLITLFRNKGYAFITLDEALTDPAYKLPEVVSTRGISWIHRWMLARGITPPPQPQPSRKVMNLNN
ncbi:MAG: polysaccharide deacetylase family protein [Cyclobacteriaceae bacterium]|nr:polysaccharide deacetylase family protein [Cyclobacteriaceae bacterium]